MPSDFVGRLFLCTFAAMFRSIFINKYILLFCLLLPIKASADDRGDQLLNQADSLYAVQEYKEALAVAQDALALCKGQESEADCLNLLAVINIRLADYEQAAKYAKLCYEMDEKSGDPDMMSSSLNTLAAIYMAAKQPKEAEQYILKGIEQAEKANNPVRMATLQAMASEVYHSMGDDRKALSYIEKAYELDKASGNHEKVMVRLVEKASVLLGLHDYKKAEESLSKVIPELRQSTNRHSLGIALNKMGMALFSQQRVDKAVPYYQEAAEIFQEQGDPYNEVHARRGLYESLWQSNPDEARRQLERFNALKDSIYSNTTAESLAKYNAEFGNDWLKLENHAERKAKLWAIALAVAAVVLAVVVWLLMRYRQRQQQRLNQELTQRIQKLLEKYNQLNDLYASAQPERKVDAENNKLTEAEREFLEKTTNTINELIIKGQIDAVHVAEQMGMSLFQLRQRLGALTSETPQSFIQSIRMQRARHLLDSHPEMTVSEIATLCAYNDTPNFIRAFKKMFGVTPTQYQEKK